MIPVRVEAGLMPVLANQRRFAAHRGHPLDECPCPVCDGPLGDGVTVLVFAGIEPSDRKPGGYTTGAAVAVHAACAGVPDEEPSDAATVAGGGGPRGASFSNGPLEPKSLRDLPRTASIWDFMEPRPYQ